MSTVNFSLTEWIVIDPVLSIREEELDTSGVISTVLDFARREIATEFTLFLPLFCYCRCFCSSPVRSL